jgi:Amt family ammonium transporter
MGTVGYPGRMAQLLIQAKAVGLVFVWTAVVAFISFYIVKLTVGLRVTEEQEREGLDISSHGERAYTA